MINSSKLIKMMLSRYDHDELRKLLTVAKNHYSSSGSVLCKYLYRNKSSAYFEDIINNRDFMMTPYMKDNGGDRYNPINRKLHGLFFYVSVKEGSAFGELPNFSYFGDTRFLAPVELLIDRSEMNLYFSDFFCLEKIRKMKTPFYFKTLFLFVRRAT